MRAKTSVHKRQKETENTQTNQNLESLKADKKSLQFKPCLIAGKWMSDNGQQVVCLCLTQHVEERINDEKETEKEKL